MLRIVCAWCGVVIKDWPLAVETSHGICEVCAARELEDDVDELYQEIGGEG